MINGSIFHLPLADKSVHCIIFSPPYWSLRDYELDPIIIGGELDCVHEWGSVLAGKTSNKQHLDERSDGGGNKASSVSHGYNSSGSFCLNCNAWRGSLGLEPTPELFIEHCRIYARECWRVLRDDGTMWVNIGASYSGFGKGGGGMNAAPHFSAPGPTPALNNYKPKDLIPTPWLFAIALQQDGWYLRSEIIWHKPNAMPSSVRDRPTVSHESVFLFSKSRRYFYDADAVRETQTGNTHSRGNGDGGAKARATAEQGRWKDWAKHTRSVEISGGRNLRSVWTIPTYGVSEAHFATFPPKLVEPMIKAGTSEGGVCVECGAQFERVVSKEQVKTDHWSDNAGRKIRSVPGRADVPKSSIFVTRMQNVNHTLGFRPPCDHYIPLYYKYFPMARNKRKRYQQFKTGHWLKRVRKRSVPLNWPTKKAIVLDPFGGAGTTEFVAIRLGRHGVSVELSPEYCRMGRDRIRDDIPPMLELVERERILKQAPLFASEEPPR